MKRKSRLMALMSLLQSGQMQRAEDLARQLEVSVRTVYRDMDTLMSSGVAIEGTRGQGYTAKADLTLPPIHITQAELEALHLGLAAIATSMDADIQAAAESLAQKLDDALPETIETAAEATHFAAYPFSGAAEGLLHLNALRAAIKARQRLRVLTDADVPHDLRPLKITYWGRLWSLQAYSDTSQSFVAIAVNQIKSITTLPGLFVDEPGKGLSDLATNTVTNLREERPITG